MPTYSKIPKKQKKRGAIVSGRYAVFLKSIIEAGKVFIALQKAEEKGMPAHGFLTIKGKKYYYCRYGFLTDPEIYAK